MFRRVLSIVLALVLICTAGCVPVSQGSSAAGSKPEQSNAGTQADKGNTVTLSGLLAKAEYPTETDEFLEVDKDFQEALERFCSKTARDLLLTDKNTIYSPISLFYALAILTEGADHETADELLALLEMQKIKDLPQACKTLFRMLYQDNMDSKLRIANSLWMKEGFPFEKSYLDDIKDNFFGSVYSVDFADAATGKLIGAWVDENTGGLVPYDYNPDPAQVLSIINTIWLKAHWADAFSERATSEAAFTLKDGRSVMTDFMHRRHSGSISIGKDFRRADLYLGGMGYMSFILPDEGVDVLSLLDQEKWDEALHGGEQYSGKIVWSVPKIKHDSKLDLEDYVREFAPLAFSGAADFSRMTPEGVCVSSVVQKAHVEWDENGVEAAAYTEIGMKATAMPNTQPETEYEMNLNRPFLYTIRSFDGTMLFCGICQEP
ncbi:MAG: serpin family protein [Firmicutes bacterium]|nr:serpin family protein [Bacillota bacterium]